MLGDVKYVTDEKGKRQEVILPSETFKTQVKTLQKKYPHIRQDLKDLSEKLKHNPKSGKARFSL